jgi:hypothetical protein
MTQQDGQWPEAADWVTGPPPPTRLGAFRAAHPDVVVFPGPGCWQADYQAADGRIGFKARYELPQLLDALEEELGHG